MHQVTCDAVANGLSSGCVDRLKPVVEVTYEPPMDVEPKNVTLKAGAQLVRSKARVYPPQNFKWLADHMAGLEAAEIVYCNNQVVYECVAMDTPEGANFFRLLSDYRLIKATIEQAAVPMSNLDALEVITGASALYRLDMLKGY